MRCCYFVASGGARPYLDDVRMQQVAVIYELTLDVLSNFAASLHKFDGDLLSCGTVHSELHLTIATGVDVLKYSVFGLCTERVGVGHLSSQSCCDPFARAIAPTRDDGTFFAALRKALSSPCIDEHEKHKQVWHGEGRGLQKCQLLISTCHHRTGWHRWPSDSEISASGNWQ